MKSSFAKEKKRKSLSQTNRKMQQERQSDRQSDRQTDRRTDWT